MNSYFGDTERVGSARFFALIRGGPLDQSMLGPLLTFASRNGTLYANNSPLILKGANWYGFETTQGVVHGLYAQPLSVFLGILQDNDFNAVRLPLDLDLILHDRKHGFIKPEPNQTAGALVEEAEDCWQQHLKAAGGDAAEAALGAASCGGPSPLMKNTSLEVLDIMIDMFAARGILVLLDLHCLSTAGTNASPLFYDDTHPVSDAVAGWSKLAQKFGDRWNVLGADVFNEPFGATWAEGKPSDMDAFAKQAAAAIHTHAPNWLVFVEGTADSPNCTSTIDGDDVECGYGDNLLGAMAAPLSLAAKDKLVYSPHTYGPSQHDRAEFHNAEFPANMPDVWSAHWGALVARRAADTPAVVLGEWGGPVSGDNGEWAEALVAYLQSTALTSNFFWALNEDGTPKGLITDWTTSPPTLDAAKLALLRKLTPHPTNVSALRAR